MATKTRQINGVSFVNKTITLGDTGLGGRLSFQKRTNFVNFLSTVSKKWLLTLCFHLAIYSNNLINCIQKAQLLSYIINISPIF